jgi:hypothetical protein
MPLADNRNRTSDTPPAALGPDAGTRLAPDPFAAVLPALSALATVASIATVAWAGQVNAPERARSRRKSAAALKDLETCCLGLAEIFRRFQRLPRIFAGEGAPAASPLKFGVHGPRVPVEAARAYRHLVNDIASMLVMAAQNAFDVMCAVEDGEIDAPEELFYGFGEQQERLNQLIQQRATLKASVDTGAEVARKLAGLLAELKKCQSR